MPENIHMSHNRSIVGLERGGGVNNAGAGGEHIAVPMSNKQTS